MGTGIKHCFMCRKCLGDHEGLVFGGEVWVCSKKHLEALTAWRKKASPYNEQLLAKAMNVHTTVEDEDLIE